MPSKKKPDWEVKAHGDQLDEIDVDLIIQVVIMLGRQLAEEALTDSSTEPLDASEARDVPSNNREEIA
jgi:hypothetical protein